MDWVSIFIVVSLIVCIISCFLQLKGRSMLTQMALIVGIAGSSCVLVGEMEIISKPLESNCETS